MTDERDPFGPHTQFCPHCSNRMRSCIQAHGLWSRVSKTREELKGRLARVDPYDVDPLMLLHNMVWGKAKHMAALNDVSLGKVATTCPTCFFSVPQWIEEAGAAVSVRMAGLVQEKLDDILNTERMNADRRGA